MPPGMSERSSTFDEKRYSSDKASTHSRVTEHEDFLQGSHPPGCLGCHILVSLPVYRGLDIFDRVKGDPVFAIRVRALRLHWAYEENDIFNFTCREFVLASRCA